MQFSSFFNAPEIKAEPNCRLTFSGYILIESLSPAEKTLPKKLVRRIPSWPRHEINDLILGALTARDSGTAETILKWQG